jgi:hypothetical protein
LVFVTALFQLSELNVRVDAGMNMISMKVSGIMKKTLMSINFWATFNELNHFLIVRYPTGGTKAQCYKTTAANWSIVGMKSALQKND